MCGFAGIVAWDNRYRFDRATLARMNARIAHRGPDGEGLWINHDTEVNPGHPQAGLAHRRLAIIDLDERANQPFTDGRGRWLAFNGEIYNYRELRRELEGLLPDYPWRTQSDTEVLLASYAAWGDKCVEHLNGMFAFAVWDENKGELFLARDRMGQKPLYLAYLDRSGRWNTSLTHQYAFESPAAIAFASELGALRQVGWVPSDTSYASVVDYLQWGYTLPTASIYNSIGRLSPGRWLLAREGGTGIGRYFEPFGEGDAGPDAPATTRASIVRAVTRQLVADVPVGCFLSGGVDSSVIAAAAKEAGQSLVTFSIGFDDPRYDETAYAARVAEHLGLPHHRFKVRPDAAADLPKLAEVFGEPFADSSALPTHYLSRETRGHVKVALSGDGGDELFGGYDRYRALRASERVPRSLRHVLAGSAAEMIPGVHPKSRGTRVKRLLRSLKLPVAERYASYLRLFDNATIAVLLHGAAFEPYAKSMTDAVSDLFVVGSRVRDPVTNALAVDRLLYLPEDLLVKVDRCSMLHALEVRSPFMDHDLVEFAATLTTPQLLKGGPKRMLREAFADRLPAWVFKRKKMGFAVPIGEWFRGELRPMLHDHLFATDSFAAAHFNTPTVRRLVDEHERERVDHSQRLYALLMLELWWRNQRRP